MDYELVDDIIERRLSEYQIAVQYIRIPSIIDDTFFHIDPKTENEVFWNMLHNVDKCDIREYIRVSDKEFSIIRTKAINKILVLMDEYPGDQRIKVNALIDLNNRGERGLLTILARRATVQIDQRSQDDDQLLTAMYTLNSVPLIAYLATFPVYKYDLQGYLPKSHYNSTASDIPIIIKKRSMLIEALESLHDIKIDAKVREYIDTIILEVQQEVNDLLLIQEIVNQLIPLQQINAFDAIYSANDINTNDSIIIAQKGEDIVYMHKSKDRLMSREIAWILDNSK